jgi:hypothetical protein
MKTKNAKIIFYFRTVWLATFQADDRKWKGLRNLSILLCLLAISTTLHCSNLAKFERPDYETNERQTSIPPLNMLQLIVVKEMVAMTPHRKQHHKMIHNSSKQKSHSKGIKKPRHRRSPFERRKKGHKYHKDHR